MRKMRAWIMAVFAVSMVLSLAGCGKDSSSLVPTYTIGGLVSGYTGTGLVLQNNGTDDLMVSTGSTTFVFVTKIAMGASYNVTVSTQPTDTTPYKVCAVTGGTGNVSSANVTNVLVTCTTSSWETLAAYSNQANFTDFTPAGESTLYTGESSSMYVYSFPTASVPLGVFTEVAATPVSFNSYDGFAWVGDKLFMAQDNTMYVYDITGDAWSTPVTNLTHTHNMSQATGDDSGYVYSMATSTAQLLKYNTVNNTFVYIDAPDDVLSTSEPRAAWDSKTKRVYLMDYNTSTAFYAFNPADNTFTLLADMPLGSESTDAFCSDRRGRIFTGDHISSSMYMYTAATDSWDTIPAPPFAIGNSPACTISADGWLYLSNSGGDFARIKVF